MAQTPITYTGKDAKFMVSGIATSALGISDVTITISRGVAEQELVGETGNYFLAGAISVEGSFTGCNLTVGGLCDVLGAMINSQPVQISGNCGAKSLHFYFKSAMITSFDFSIGTADEITEGSMDFTLLYPYKVSSVTDLAGGGTYISDFA